MLVSSAEDTAGPDGPDRGGGRRAAPGRWPGRTRLTVTAAAEGLAHRLHGLPRRWRAAAFCLGVRRDGRPEAGDIIMAVLDAARRAAGRRDRPTRTNCPARWIKTTLMIVADDPRQLRFLRGGARPGAVVAAQVIHFNIQTGRPRSPTSARTSTRWRPTSGTCYPAAWPRGRRRAGPAGAGQPAGQAPARPAIVDAHRYTGVPDRGPGTTAFHTSGLSAVAGDPATWSRPARSAGCSGQPFLGPRGVSQP